MIYECTDCDNCANFNDGDRIFCMVPDLPPDEVCKYQFLGDKDASYCPHFKDQGCPHWFSQAQLKEAFAVPDDKGMAYSWGGVRKWLEAFRQ